jgi:hypothetical protein
MVSEVMREAGALASMRVTVLVMMMESGPPRSMIRRTLRGITVANGLLESTRTRAPALIIVTGRAAR